MNKKLLLLLLVMVVTFIGLSTTCAVTQQSNNVTFYAEAQDPIPIGELANAIEVQPFYKNYNHTTLNWLKQLDSKYVIFENDDYYIIMNSSDADKLLKNDKSGMTYHNNFTANVLENYSLGNQLKYIVLVDNVNLTSHKLKV